MAESESESDSREVSSVLSDNQRRWLKGEDVFDSPDRVVRSRIRDRYKQAFADFALLHETGRMDRGELMKSVRDTNYDSKSSVNSSLASETEVDPESIADMLDSAIAQLETASGTGIEDFDLTDMITQIRRVKGRHGTLDDETVLTFAVAGAMSGLMGTGKTEKQARQWVEHHWPESDDVLEQWDKASRFVDN